MKLKIQGQGNWLTTSTLEVVNENTIRIDEEVYEFPNDIVIFDVDFPLIEAKRIDGELYIHVVIKYCDTDKPWWDANRPYLNEAYEEFDVGEILWS